MRAPSKATQKICTFFRKKRPCYCTVGEKKTFFALFYMLHWGKKFKCHRIPICNHVQLGRSCFFLAAFPPLCSCFFPALLQNKTIAAITTSLFFCFLAPIVVDFCVPFCDIWETILAKKNWFVVPIIISLFFLKKKKNTTKKRKKETRTTSTLFWFLSALFCKSNASLLL